MASDPKGTMANGAAFVPPAFYNLPGFGYANLDDQMADAQGNWAKGAGIFAGNNVPKYNGIAGGAGVPASFGGGFATMAPNVGGGLLGKTAYSGGFNPFAGRGNGGGSPGAPVPPKSTETQPPGGNPGGPPPGYGNPPGSPPGQPPGYPVPPGVPPPTPIPGQGVADGVPFPQWAQNYGTPPAANNTPTNANLAASMLPGDASKLLGLLGGNQAAANQMNNAYGPGGMYYNPQKTADLQRGESNGISTLMPAIKAMYEANGIIKDGRWAKKQDDNGNWIPV